jgi:hypothetical protein
MVRYLVVANQTIAEAPLAEAIAARLRAGNCEFFIVVPATPPHELLTWTDGGARSIAKRRLAEAIAVLRACDASVDGEAGDPSPVVAAADALRRGPAYDEIIVSTFPPGVSRWLKMDLPSRLARMSRLPVCHLIASPYAAPASGGSDSLL